VSFSRQRAQTRRRGKKCSPQDLQRELDGRYRIEVPVGEFNGRRWARCSCQVYNAPAQYERLADAVDELRDGR